MGKDDRKTKAQLIAELSELKAESTALEHERDKYRALVENINDVIFAVNTEGIITYVSPVVQQVFNYNPREVIGQNFLNFVHPDDQPGLRGRFERIMTGELEPRDFRLLSKDGDVVHVRTFSRPQEENGQIVGVTGTIVNITARKATEQELYRRNRELELLNRASLMFNSTLDLDQVLENVLQGIRDLWDAVTASIWLLDPETEELVCRQSSGLHSDALRGWRMMPRSGIAGWVARHDENLIVPDIQVDERHTRELDEQIGLTPRAIICVPLHIKEKMVGVLQVLDTEVGRFDETALPLLESLAAVAANAIENARLYQQAQQEIVKREEVERRLRESEEMFHQIADNLPGVVWLNDPGMSHTYYISPSIADYYGVSQEKEYQHPGSCSDAVHPADLAKTLEALELQKQGWATSVEYRVTRPDGTTRWMLDRAFPIRDETGEISRVVAIAVDITKRKQTEDELCAALHEKEILLQEVHHRVKNNLQIIISLLELQTEYTQEPKVLHILRDSQYRIRTMALVHEYLYQAPDLTSIDTARYIDNLTGYLFQAYESLSRVKLRIDVQDVFLDLNAAIPCGLIINELISNALEHAFPAERTTAEQSDEIRIALQPESEDRIALIIADNGIGLSAEVDLQNPPSLGLELVQLLTRQLKGKIEVDRRDGTEFKIVFPF